MLLSRAKTERMQEGRGSITMAAPEAVFEGEQAIMEDERNPWMQWFIIKLGREFWHIFDVLRVKRNT